MIASPLVDWEALRQVVLYSLAGGIAVPAIFALSIRAAARSAEVRSSFASGAYVVLSAVGGLICVAAIVFGIVLMAR